MNNNSFIIGMQYIWSYANCSNNIYEISNLAAQLNISLPIATVLYNRGYKTKKEALLFLFPIYDLKIYDPKLLHNAELSIDRILKAISNNEKILICGDYDVDGVTSTSLLLHALLELKADANFFLPNRVYDGYGLSVKTVDRAKSSGYKLLITVDNGTCAFEALLKAKELGLDVIVTDHHQPKHFPDGVLYLVNPHQKECRYPFKDLAGVGVVFKLVSLLYEILNKPLPDKIYELFLLGTVADLVPLIQENRYWVSYCLEKVKKNTSYSIELLKKNAKMNDEKKLTSQDVAFSLAPQINALGRLDDPRSGVLFFIQEDMDLLDSIAFKLSSLNIDRKKKEKDSIDSLLLEIQNDKVHPHDDGCIVKSSKGFPVGIIGLIAARLNQQYYVPVCIFNETSSGILKGSCRTIPKCNLFEILSMMDQKLLLSFGGHKAAAGVSLKKENLLEFKEAFSDSVFKVCKKTDFQQKIIIDSYLEIEEINSKLWQDLILLEPFGSENSVPIFCINEVIVLEIKIIKDIHVKLILASVEKKITSIFFNRIDIINKVKINQKISLIAKITQNIWNDKVSIELQGIDICIILD
jgi:single-stranded-DNA-specific exonuclease